MIRTIFLDAAGTLIHLTKSVGEHYAFAGREVGVNLDPAKLDRAFAKWWRRMPPRPPIDRPREDDDKPWWRDLVEHVLNQAAPSLHELDRDNLFQVAYDHFAEPGVWELYPEVLDVLTRLRANFEIAVISNFDGRLRFVLEHLGISKFFRGVFLSSELGADKPDPEIFRRALRLMNLEPNQALHAGDDPERDWEAAAAAGLSIFKLERPKNSLRDLVNFLEL